MRVGTATAPLHTGRCPPWLFKRMKALARAIAVHVVEHGGQEELLRRLSDPIWFHAFGCVLGFDWNSSGVTTTVCGALKEGLAGASRELGVYVCGGKGRASRKTPLEIATACGTTGQDGDALTAGSRMAAKVDSACVQDGFQLYHHVFVFTTSGAWAVVQQGLRQEDRTARRYHWLGGQDDIASLCAALDYRKTRTEPSLFEPITQTTEKAPPAFSVHGAKSFVCDPHAAIASEAGSRRHILNLVAGEAAGNRSKSVQAACLKPHELLNKLSHLDRDALALPTRHDIRLADLDVSRLERILLRTIERQPRTFEALAAFQGVGAKTLRALSLAAELIYAEPASFRDPARFSFAHGGKDGHPYPVNRVVYDEVIHHLGETVNAAKLAHTETAESLKRLAKWGRTAPGR